MSQGKSAVTLELLDDISDEQIHEAEAYAALYALGGYTYNNVIHEVFFILFITKNYFTSLVLCT